MPPRHGHARALKRRKPEWWAGPQTARDPAVRSGVGGGRPEGGSGRGASDQRTGGFGPRGAAGGVQALRPAYERARKRSLGGLARRVRVGGSPRRIPAI
ncbi:hypothetical protein PAHAL_7G161100 [Panicum hallii]|uniref:Uncharacterized protein n=1 Tax=Panicum hallii TaxID=206008 RepID=A0A2T8ICF6_9POAL|nr:hypothetical protein PAHAL_7G161100 [Panicum hallii]